MAWKRWDFMQVQRENGTIQWTHLFCLQIHSLSPTFNRGRSIGRPELAGSKMAVLFSSDSWNSAKSEIQARHLTGGRTQWFFHPFHIWSYQHERTKIRMMTLIQGKKKEQYSLRYRESGSRLTCRHGRSLIFCTPEHTKNACYYYRTILYVMVW